MFCKTNAAAGVDPEALLGLVVTGFEGVYDGESHTVTASVNPDYQATTSYRYSTDGTSWTYSAPSRVNAGNTVVYVRAINTILGTFEAQTEINIAPAPVTLTADSLTTTYNRYGYAQTVETYTCNVSGVSFASTVKAYGSGTNVGEYDVTFTGVTLDETTDTTGNYVIAETVNGKIIINKAPADYLGLRVWDYTGDYDGSAHGVTVSVSVTAGTTIEYSTNGTSWSQTEVKRTEIGSTVVYVRAVNSNFETATASGTITIKEPKATLIVIWFAGEPLSLFAPDGSAVLELSTTGYYSAQPTQVGYYTAVYPNHDPLQRQVYVESTTSGTYTIAW